MGVTRKQSTPNFLENEHFLPSDTHGVRNVIFRKIWHTLFSCNTRFEIRPFILMPAIWRLSQIFNLR